MRGEVPEKNCQSPERFTVHTRLRASTLVIVPMDRRECGVCGRSRAIQGADQILCRRGGTRPSSALRLLRPGPSRPHAHSVRACGRPVGQRLPFDARAVCLPPVAAVAPVSAPSGDDACCSATALHGSGLSSGAAMAAATSAGVMRAHFGARYTWPQRCCAGCRTAAADHLLLETMGCAAVGRSFVMSSNSTEAWDAQEWVVTELQHHPCRLFHPYPLELL